MTEAFNNNRDTMICRQCQGLCCQGHPGVWTDPERFLKAFDLPRPSTPSRFLGMLPREISLRDIDRVAIPAPKATESGCIFLEIEGCALPVNRRPEQCLALTPHIDTLLAGEICCELQPEGSTLTAIRNWKAFWGNNPVT